uniref:Ubiquitin-like protease family profile domain-containing protein n=1 Tax=Oryza nivara TaxID=4536 RepID=A0A0E0IZX7_ORYNI
MDNEAESCERKAPEILLSGGEGEGGGERWAVHRERPRTAPEKRGGGRGVDALQSDNKVANSDYANSISEEEETSDSDKYITKKDLVSRLKDLDRSKGKEHTKLEYDQDKSGSAESPKPRSRLNITYFSNLIEGLSNEQRSIIEKSAFGSLLNFQRCAIPLSFVKWIASHTDVSCLDIVVNGRSIPINPNTTNFILGIPNGGLEIKHDNDAGKHFFHQHFGSTKPLISFFGTKLLSDKGVNKLSKDDVLRCFMVVALSTFFCPNSDTHPSPKYLEPLIDIKSSSKWNWSKFVYEWLMTYIAKFQKESKSKEQTSKTLGGCGHLLAINYLDFKDFGIRNIPIGPPPRISVWKGGMIKEYSKMDECKTGDFGKRPIKAKEKLSYDAICSGARCIEQQGNNSNMSCNDALRQYHSKSFNPRLIDDISTACKWFTREHSDTTYGKNAQLATKVLDCVYMSKASLFTQKDTTTTREEKSGEEKSKGGSKQGGSNVAHNGNAPPLEQNHPNNTDVCSQLPKTPQTKSTAEHKTKSNINNTSNSKGAAPTDKKASSKDFVCSQQSNNSVASRTRAKRLHSASPLSVVSISPSKKNSSNQKIHKAVRKQPLKATEPISTQPDREESNKDGLFVEPICTIPAKKEEVQPTKNLESNSTEFVIDIEGPYDAEDITGHTTDKTKFILQPQINNEQSSPQTPLHINIASARTPATKQSSQSSPDIGMNSPRIAQMREPNQHAQTEERQYSMIRIIDSLNASANCSSTRHNLYRPKRIVHPILMDNVKVTWSSLSKSLSPRGVVDTYVLNAYAKKIANDQNNKENEYMNFYFFHRTSVYFLKNWEGTGKEEDYENCARQAFTFARNKKPLHYYDLGHHFIFLDSIYDENNKYHKKIQGLLIPGFIAMWEEFSDVEKNFSKFDIQYPPITSQNNGHDCGIYAMKCIEWWNPRMHLKDMIRPEYIPNMRKQIANDLLFLEHNSQEEAKMLARSFNPTKHGKYARQQ